MVASSRWMSQLDCHPSVIIWVVFNEAWGQFKTEEVNIFFSPLFLGCLLKIDCEFWLLCAHHAIGHSF